MGVVHVPDSAYAKEMCKWNAHHSEFGPPGRPYTFQPYPARMYKAARLPDGTRAIVEAQDAGNADEQRRLETRGFVAGGQGAALEALDAQEREYAQLAAERNFEVRRMSEGARSEVAQAEDEAGARHLPVIPERPKRRRGRRAKVQEQPHAGD